MEGLRAKILEEANEFIENPCEEEAADMLEVLFAFTHLNGIDFEDVLEVAREKAEERGGFFNGIILEEVSNENR
jgi:predicted house-cleaning noncanonical NTP pyrophosphatase (MazG superfamily)